MIQDGDKAPAFTLETDNDGSISLKKFKGRWLVLYFYPKDDTSGCTAESKDFSCLINDFDSAGASVIGVSPGSVESKAKFRKKHDLAITLAADPDNALATAYGVWVEKSMYGRKYMGIERSTFLIDPNGRIAHVWRKVKVPGHAQQVLKVVQQLAAR